MRQTPLVVGAPADCPATLPSARLWFFSFSLSIPVSPSSSSLALFSPCTLPSFSVLVFVPFTHSILAPLPLTTVFFFPGAFTLNLSPIHFLFLHPYASLPPSFHSSLPSLFSLFLFTFFTLNSLRSTPTCDSVGSAPRPVIREKSEHPSNNITKATKIQG